MPWKPRTKRVAVRANANLTDLRYGEEAEVDLTAQVEARARSGLVTILHPVPGEPAVTSDENPDAANSEEKSEEPPDEPPDDPWGG